MRIQSFLPIFFCFFLSGITAGQFQPADPIPFAKHKLDGGAYESTAVTDINKDGILDIVSGSRWYEGPSWRSHFVRNIPKWDIHFDSLSDIAFDVNQDGYPDIITCFYLDKRVAWYENPRGDWDRKNGWKEHKIATTDGSVEFLFFVDLEKRGHPHALFPNMPSQNNPIIWFDYKFDGGEPRWMRYEVSADGNGHGMGFGDINGDGFIDIVVPSGWYESPREIRNGEWRSHLDFRIIPEPRSNAAGNIYIYDVDGDGDADILTGAGHDYGVYWWEQIPGDRINWKVHTIDKTWSQSHSAALVDMDGDGDCDFVTGKRFWGHGVSDPGSLEPGIIVWYELQRSSPVLWIKRVIDYNIDMGVGMQFPVVDVDKDGDFDLVAAGKKGLFLYENLTLSKTQK
jgi:hypothetical protein